MKKKIDKGLDYQPEIIQAFVYLMSYVNVSFADTSPYFQRATLMEALGVRTM